MTGPLPPRVLAFYGDDFTGSSAVMEVLTFAGLPTVMFLAPPSAAELERFAEFRVIGMASTARARSPDWMDAHLPEAFETLKALGAPILHYKVCSTFDSAPDLGSIGRAIEIGRRVCGNAPVPLVVGAPAIGRFQAFGTLFAAYDGAVHRLDRHPVMARHPATPMGEADLARHLSAQTDLSTSLVDLRELTAGHGEAAFDRAVAAGAAIVSLDVLDDATLAAAGALLWKRGGFVAGSQGVEYALVGHLRAAGLLDFAPATDAVAPAGRMAALSGSVSPVTAAQIAHAEARGFVSVPLDAARAAETGNWDAAVDDASRACAAALDARRIPLVATARGPDDPSVARFRAAAAQAPAGTLAERVGTGLGRIARRLVEQHGLQRLVLSGGDSSGHAASMMGITALSAIAPLAPGAPLCRAWSDVDAIDGLEICLKGGQMGGADFFSLAAGKDGT